MNKILQLFDESFVLGYFKRELLPLFPEYSDIIAVKIKPYKKLIWNTTYHVVVSFEVEFLKREELQEEDASLRAAFQNNNKAQEDSYIQKSEKLFLVCSAHSEEPRENVFKVLNFLLKEDFASDSIDIPTPLFFSPEFHGVFYIGLKGENILKKIREGGELAENKIVLSAKMFARLHSLSLENASDFNPESSKIKTVVPGVESIFREMSARYNKIYDEDLKTFYNYFIEKEEEFFKEKKNLSLIHGDAHLENIIDTGVGRVGVIDFADLCLSDFARDLGTFLQQLEYRATSIKTGLRNPEENQKFKKIFLGTYLKERNLILDDNLKERIKLYYDWTMLRTATYFFLKAEVELERAEKLFSKVKESLESKNLFF